MIMPALSAVPGPDSTFEHYAVSGIQEHLRRATCSRSVDTLIVILKYKTEVTNARSNGGKLPRAGAGFVICSRCNIPRHLGAAFTEIADWITKCVKEFKRRDSALLHDLRENPFPQQTTFQLPPKIGFVMIRLGLI